MSMSQPKGPELVKQLVAACLERLPEEGEAVVATVCRDHPEQLATVRKLLGSLGRVGLIEPEGPTGNGRPDVIGGYRLLEELSVESADVLAGGVAP